jgi:O-antigen ligase
MLVLDKSEKNYFAQNKILFLVSMMMMIPVFMLLHEYRLDIKILGLIIGIPLLSLFVFSYETMWKAFLFALFLNFSPLGFEIVVLMVIPLSIAFIFTHTSNCDTKIKTGILAPAIIYVLSVIPSFINSTNIPLSFYFSFNLIAFILLIYLIMHHINNYTQIKNFFKIYLGLAIANGISIIYLVVSTQKRLFGFTGIVYVDYVCIAMLMSIILAFFKKGNLGLFYSLISIFLFTSLLFTQTRNTFISFGATLISLFFFLFRNGKTFKIKRKTFIVTSILSLILLTGFVFILYSAFPLIFDRISQLSSGEKFNYASETDFGVSSLLTRLLIWHTALQAFLKHPIVGIGAFSFPFESVFYSKIPPFLFKKFVQGLSPHETFIAKLTETGIVGFLGFIVFMISSLRVSFKAFKLTIEKEEKIISLILLSIQLYVFFSMFLTDAWLWGQCGMLWGLLLGISLANYKILLIRRKKMSQNAK